ncbi:MAG: hypothetical protein ACFCVH_03615 [Alphaproteobacteria bacterium]
MKNDDLIAYFNEHISYELDMLRGAHARSQNCADVVMSRHRWRSLCFASRNQLYCKA